MRIRDRIQRSRVRPARGPRERPSAPPPDPFFTFQRFGQTWTFSGGKVMLDGYDINPMISEEEPTISTLIGLASGLGDYKKRVGSLRKKAHSTGKLLGMIDALLEKILGRVKKVYDEKMYGLSWTLKDNELIVNGVNVHSFLALYRVRKTRKAKKFLKGIKNKVDMLIANKAGSWRNEKVRRRILAIQREIDEELAQDAPTSNTRRLLRSGPSGS